MLCTVAAVIAYYYPKPWTFPSLIVAGGLITLVAMRKNEIKVGPGWSGGELGVEGQQQRACIQGRLQGLWQGCKAAQL